jgi:hypothetical protein
MATISGATMTPHESTLIGWIHLVEAEYLDMPGLQLTKPQVRRMWGLEDSTCDEVLKVLVAAHFLRVTERDLYVLEAASC